MIVEARCSDCDKHIGYFSMTGFVDGLKDTKYVKNISYQSLTLTLICDKCRDGKVDIEEERIEGTGGRTAWQQHA